MKSHSIPQHSWGSPAARAPSEHKLHDLLCNLRQAALPLKAVFSSSVKQGEYRMHRLVTRTKWNIYKALNTWYELHGQLLLMTFGYMSFQCLLLCKCTSYRQIYTVKMQAESQYSSRVRTECYYLNPVHGSRAQMLFAPSVPHTASHSSPWRSDRSLPPTSRWSSS